MPEFNEMCSLDQFIAAFQANDLLFKKRVQSYISAGLYFDFISGVRYSHGMEHLSLVLKEVGIGVCLRLSDNIFRSWRGSVTRMMKRMRCLTYIAIKSGRPINSH